MELPLGRLETSKWPSMSQTNVNKGTVSTLWYTNNQIHHVPQDLRL